ncbi:MAG: hypothetical protein JW873_04920 [Candidatus Saganbacteria bacterium]|nr:hypothetical protein [Candidatus Saganbacteria bacterium]
MTYVSALIPSLTLAAGLNKKGEGSSVKAIAGEVVKILENDGTDNASVKAADYLKGQTTSAEKQGKVLEEVRKALIATGEYDNNSINTVIGDIRNRLRSASAPKAEEVRPAAAAASGELKGEIVSITKTGSFGGDGSPQVNIKVKIENLPAGAHTLSGFLRTNKDWPAGGCTTGGKSSGTFTFQAYLHPGNQSSPFYIEVADKYGKKLGRIPEGDYDTLKVRFPR